jgi:hypothetical protein
MSFDAATLAAVTWIPGPWMQALMQAAMDMGPTVAFAPSRGGSRAPSASQIADMEMQGFERCGSVALGLASAEGALIGPAAGGVPKWLVQAAGGRVIMQTGSSEYTSIYSVLSSLTGGGGALRTLANVGSEAALPLAVLSAAADSWAFARCVY